MKKILLPILGLSFAIPSFAQGLDLQNTILLNRAKMTRDGKIIDFKRNNGIFPLNNQLTTRSVYQDSNTDYIRAFVKVAEGFSKEDLQAAGLHVNTMKGKIAIVTIPLDFVEILPTLDCVKSFSLEKKMDAKIDFSRKATGIDDIHQGKDLKIPYTGKGVLGILVDQGVDPNHLAFLDKEGKSRVKYLTYYDGTAAPNGYPKTQYFGDDIIYEDEKGNVLSYPTIDQFFTDTYFAYHGTHTLNIFGGGYKGNVTIGENGKTKEIANPYYGAAPESELAVSCGDLSDACVAMGLAEMLSYAEYRKEVDGTPAVVSMSLGSTAGAHDPNYYMNEFLDYCGEESIICISAGNEGDLKIALNKTLTNEENSLKTMIYPYGYRYEKSEGAPSAQNTYYRNGVVMIYSNDATPFQVRGFIMTGTPGNYRRRATLNLNFEEGSYYASDNNYANYVNGTVNSTVGKYFTGYIGGGAMLDQELGRYYGAFDYYLITDPENGINPDGSEAAIVGFEIIGENGQRIDCYCDGANTWMYNYDMADYDDGSTDGTISDMAVGYNLLVVGAYNERSSMTALDGKEYKMEPEEIFKKGEIGPYSSYGTLVDGRTLPHVVAPGTSVISAFSQPYVEYTFQGYENYIPSNTNAKATIDNRDYYWVAETGTSMSTPLVAGSIALWLEADPTLTLEDVRDIINKTAVKDEFVINGDPVRWGAGKFDALAGLKEVISRANAGVDQIEAENRNDRMIITQNGEGIFDIYVGSAKSLDINVYSIAGQKSFSGLYPGSETSIDLSYLSKGVYILKVNNHTEKIYIK